MGEERHRSCRHRVTTFLTDKGVKLQITDVPAEAFHRLETVIASSCQTQSASGRRGWWWFSRFGNRQKRKHPRTVDQTEVLIMGDFRHLVRQKVAEGFGTRDGVVFSARV